MSARLGILWRRAWADLLALLVLGALAACLPPLAARWARPTLLDVGPNDRAYVHGFRADWERQGNWQFRWTSPSARVRVPLHLQGEGARLRLRLARHLTEPARVRLIVEGRTVHSFEIWADRKALYRVVETGLPALRGQHPFELTIEAPSTNPRPLGVALDWVELDRGENGARFILPTPTLLRVVLLTLLVLATTRAWGASRRLAALAACGALLATTTGLWADLLATERVLRHGLPAIAFVALVSVLLVRWSATRTALGIPRETAAWLGLLALSALGVRLVALLHPRFFYPDVWIHGLFAHTLAKQGLVAFLQEFTANQFRYSLGLQFENGHWYAFPYPPGFYLLTWPVTRLLELRPEPTVAVALVAAVANSLETFLVFGIARRLGLRVGSSLFAASAVVVLPIFIARLTLGYFPAIVGHFVDCVVLLFLLRNAHRLDRPRTVLILGTLVAAALLTYTQSLLNLALILPVFLLAQCIGDREPGARRRQLGLLAGGLLGATLAVGLFYGKYIPVFLDMQRGVPQEGEQIVLDIFERRAAVEEATVEEADDPYAGPGFDPLRGLSKAGWRLWIFYSAFAPVILLGLGLLLLRLRDEGTTRRLVIAWALTYLVLNLASGGLPGPNLVRYNKDIEVVAPLACVCLALVGSWLWERSRWLALAYGSAFWLLSASRLVQYLAERMTLVR